MIYGKIVGGELTAGAYTPSPNLPAAKLTSQGDAHMRTNAQINYCINHWLQTFGLAVLTTPSRLAFNSIFPIVHQLEFPKFV